ncbi:TonB-dependent receptor plug domain-containing protein [Marinicella rhabdoformis]|uniref:TonB-dependent receptor plug domain-containing protein n=1 Tax=Marinicella rhabdoformis TaxID=2580566 RepID=UPI0012AEBDC9|nr:TonB-dependent receptor [Marinicella rhabdoformis]
MSRLHRRAALCVAISSILSTAAIAQSETPEVIDSMVVSASAEAIQANQFGGSLTVITSEQIEAAAATYLSGVLRQVPGFAVSQSGGIGTQTQIRVRGSEANHILVMVNGVRVNDPALGDEFLSHYAMTQNVERIEIIRGPQSALWGSDALAGVVNIITKKAQDTYGALEVEAGSFNSKKLGLTGGTAGEKFQLNGGVQLTDTAGTNISRQGSEEDGFENTNLNVSAQYQATDAMAWTFQANHNDSMNEYDGTDFTTGFPADSDDWTEATLTQGQVALAIEPDNGFWNADLAYQITQSDNDNFGLSFIDGSPVSTGSTEAETRTFKFNNSFNLGQDQRVSVLLDHRDVDFAQTGVASAYGDPNQAQSYSVLGLAAEYAQQVTEALFWNISARQDEFNKFEDVSMYNAAASYQINDAFRIKAAVGTGSKAPSFIERFGYTPNSFLGNPDLKPEESQSWELGLEYQYDANRFSVVYFDQNLENEIDGFAFDGVSGMFTAVNKPGESKRSGIELNWLGQMTDNLNLDFNYTYTDAEEQLLVTAASGVDYATEIRRPEHMANLTMNYQFAENRANVYAQARYLGEQIDTFFDPVTYAAVPTELDASTNVDLTFTWNFTDATKVYVKGQNIFDESNEEVLGYARPGAGYYIGVKTNF